VHSAQAHAKAECNRLGTNLRFVVTNRPGGTGADGWSGRVTLLFRFLLEGYDMLRHVSIQCLVVSAGVLVWGLGARAEVVIETVSA
jgi:hypothetical protein